jgi:hypothetical protein
VKFTVKERKARKAESSRRWRLKNPDYYKTRRKPLTPEQKARKAAKTALWRKRNVAHVRAWNRAYLEKRKAWARKRYAEKPAFRDKHRERCRVWRARNPNYSREWYHKMREHFIGEGRWSKRTRDRNARWRKWARVCAQSRHA